MRILTVIPTYGHHDVTAGLLEDIEREDPVDVDVMVIDNAGNYPMGASAREYVVQPPENLGWLRSVNLALVTNSDAVIALNNDTRLSPGFFDGMRAALRVVEDRGTVGIVAPMYDDQWPTQKCQYSGPAVDYPPTPVDRAVPFVDGTCFALSRRTISKVGQLDRRFEAHGWGADFDYCLRVREQGGEVVATNRAYINHLGRVTARDMPGWPDEASAEMQSGMIAKYGPEWKQLVGQGVI